MTHLHGCHLYHNITLKYVHSKKSDDVQEIDFLESICMTSAMCFLTLQHLTSAAVGSGVVQLAQHHIPLLSFK